MSDFDGLRSCYETQTAGLGIPFCLVGASSYNVFLVAGSVRIPQPLDCLQVHIVKYVLGCELRHSLELPVLGLVPTSSSLPTGFIK